LFSIWFSFAVAGSPPALSTAGALVPAFLACGSWITAAIGSMDDRNHRELLAAAAGSPARLHLARSLTSFAICFGATAICVAFVAATLDEPDKSAIIVASANGTALLGASLLAVAIGSWLYPPLIKQRAVAVLAGLAAVIGVGLLPPIGATLKSLGNGHFSQTIVFGVVSGLVSVSAVFASSQMSNRI